MQNIRNHLRTIFWLLIFTGLAAGIWQGSQPHLFHTSISPRKVYRIEYYEASYLQSLVHHEFKMPGFARLYRIQPETLLGESNVADLWMNGELYWWLNPPVNAVQVGRDIVFENIPPECTDCPRLPDSAVMP
ncbi:hypothetical protein AVKW3434_23180 [Acidovorax sp. SUPP3434]|uniref:hypothetical protein n=1 Tax=Acidovorax sp. SUPP3434 TaxID=2920880 RepID=UPI0023DE235B|nr:hypothetical protein [Acidovorax sp. SUPP3434]GKT02347.1 hypothetical protein AVKW3434_23180 [Acidovorax sp. SUPP3434]